MKIVATQTEPVYTIEFTEYEVKEILQSWVGVNSVNWKPAMHRFMDLLAGRK